MNHRADEKIKSKINKLLALSASDNENEARIALRQAMSLMKKHSLCKTDLDTVEINTLTLMTRYKQLPQWCRMLASQTSRALGVYVVSGTGAHLDSGYAELYFTGADGAADRAEFVFITASRTIEQLATKWRQSQNPKPSRAACNDYRQGLVIAYAKRVKAVYGDMEQEMAREPGMALIPIDTRLSEAADFYAASLPEDVRLQSNASYRRNSSALHAGISDGKNVSVSQGVKGNTKRTLALN